MMIALKINCFQSQEQVTEFVNWLSVQGEQLFNEYKNKDTHALAIDTKETFGKTGQMQWSGTTGIVILKE